MSIAVSHTGYTVTAWPERAASPDILYLHVGDVPTAAATQIAGGWRIVLYGSGDRDATIGANVGDHNDAMAWLEALGQLAAAAAVAA